MIFTKTIFFQKKIFVLNKYLHPLSKNLILLKKIYPAKKTHSVKHEFYFQFSFATNEQVCMIVKIYKYFFEILLL